jgi:hypothetical protein
LEKPQHAFKLFGVLDDRDRHYEHEDWEGPHVKNRTQATFDLIRHLAKDEIFSNHRKKNSVNALQRAVSGMKDSCTIM